MMILYLIIYIYIRFAMETPEQKRKNRRVSEKKRGGLPYYGE